MATLQFPGSFKIGSSSFVGMSKYARGFYDFAVDGGAVGAITLRGDSIPSGSIVVDTFVNVDTIVTSGGAATVSLGIQTAVDIRAVATDLTTAPALSTLGPKHGLITGASVPSTTTAIRPVIATIATAALTAGKFSVIVEYLELA